jgi:chromosome partitioning protein
VAAKTICIANQKGGVGKTTTAINLSTSLALGGKKTLLVDIDPQGNAGSGVGQGANGRANIYDALVTGAAMSSVVQATSVENMGIACSTIDLTGAEIELVTMPEREFRLRTTLEQVRREFDFIIIDCPPSLGLLTINALTAADSVLIPLQCEYYALEGLSQLLNTIKLVKSRLNPELALEGILLTMFDKRNNLARQVADEIVKHFSTKVFKVVVPRTVRLAECPSHGKPIYYYDRHSAAAHCYLDLAREVLERSGMSPADFAHSPESSQAQAPAAGPPEVN